MEREQRIHTLLGNLFTPKVVEARSYVTGILTDEPVYDAKTFMDTLQTKLQPNGKDIKRYVWQDPESVTTIFHHISRLSGRDAEEVYRRTHPYQFIEHKVLKTPGMLDTIIRSTAISDLRFSLFIQMNGPHPLDTVRFNITSGMLAYFQRMAIPHLPVITGVSPFPYHKDGETRVGIGLVNGNGPAGGFVGTVETHIPASYWR